MMTARSNCHVIGASIIFFIIGIFWTTLIHVLLKTGSLADKRARHCQAPSPLL